MNAEVTSVLHDPAFNGVFILFVRTKGGAVGRVEWFDSDKGPFNGGRFGDGYAGSTGSGLGHRPLRDFRLIDGFAVHDVMFRAELILVSHPRFHNLPPKPP